MKGVQRTAASNAEQKFFTDSTTIDSIEIPMAILRFSTMSS